MTDPTNIDRHQGVAVWRQIAEALRAEIRQRAFEPAGRLPTENDLAQRFGVNRHTLRRAVASLQEEGLVRVEQGRGIFLESAILDYRLGRRTRFSENIRQHRMEPSGEVLSSGEVPATEAMAEALGLIKGAPVSAFEVASRADSYPVSIATHCFPARRFPGILDAYAECGSITVALARCGLSDYTRKVTRITARPPDAREARLLQIPRSRAVLVTESVNVDDAGVPVEYGITRFAADRVQLVVEN